MDFAEKGRAFCRELLAAGHDGGLQTFDAFDARAAELRAQGAGDEDLRTFFAAGTRECLRIATANRS